MKVNQISGILNDVFKEVLGDNLIAEDLGNIVSTGTIITSSTDFGDNFENYAGKIVDKVGRTIFVNRIYKTQDLGIWRDSFEYGSVLEKIRVEVGKYDDNAEWTLTKDTDSDGDLDYNENIATHIADLFKFYPAKIRAKYFNLKTTFKSVISITQKQLRSAFNSASDMARFIGMIEQRIMTKMEIAKDQLQRRTLANFIGERIYNGGATLVDLKTAYAATGAVAPATLKAALKDKEFIRFMAKRITEDRKLMACPSNIYSDLDGDFYNFTPEDDARLIVLQDVDTALRFNLYGDTYNKEFVTLDGYRMIPFWQGTGGTMDLADRSALYITTTEDHAISRNAILGVLFDRDAVMICNDDPEVRANYNADGNFTNFLYCADCSYYNDFDENGIVYVYGDGDAFDIGDIEVKLEAGASNGKTKVSSNGITGTTTDTTAVYGKVFDADAVPTLTVGDSFTTTGYSAITAGTTAFDATAGQTLVTVGVDTNTKITGLGTKTILASEIKSGS